MKAVNKREPFLGGRVTLRDDLNHHKCQRGAPSSRITPAAAPGDPRTKPAPVSRQAQRIGVSLGGWVVMLTVRPCLS